MRWTKTLLIVGCFLPLGNPSAFGQPPAVAPAQSEPKQNAESAPRKPFQDLFSLENQPPAVPSEEELLVWFDSLDSESFGKREWASRNLDEHFELAFPFLEQEFEGATGEKLTRLLFVLEKAMVAESKLNQKASQLLAKLTRQSSGNRKFQIQSIYESLRVEIGERAWSHIQKLCPQTPNRFISRSTNLDVLYPLVIDSSFLGDATDLQNLSQVDRVQFVRLEGSNITRDHLQAVLQLPHLKHLQLVKVPLNLEDLKLLTEGPELEVLELIQFPIEAEILAMLPDLPVSESLWLFETGLSLEDSEVAQSLVSEIELFVSRGGYLGIGCDANSLTLTRVEPESAAEQAGLKMRDVIKKINGVELANFSELRRELAKFSPGETVTLEYVTEVYGDNGDLDGLRDDLAPNLFSPIGKKEIRTIPITLGRQTR